ncbi:MAG TPA: glycosyltransferase family 39 protein [Vicinamibacterales bacterium]|nr:glycosyltransferase family 39 protein [Vicinamibacterales bacterium]
MRDPAAAVPHRLPRVQTLAGPLGGALLLVGLAGTTARASAKPLWHDEIFTLYLATLPRVGDLWRALADGVDLNPPLYHLAVRLTVGVLGPTELAVRVPALAGFAVACLALYAFARFRWGAGPALVGAMVPALTGTYLYAYEGRPYGLVLGLSAVALLAWQRREDERWRRAAPLVCAATLTAAVWTHYYAVLLVVTLAAGELARAIARRRVDVGQWLALAVPLGALAALLPLVSRARTFAATFWSPPAIGMLASAYADLVDPLGLVVLALGVGLAAAVVAGRLRPAGPEGARAVRAVPLADVVVLIALVGLPVAGYALAQMVTGAFHERYVIASVLGVAGLSACACATLARRPAVLTIVFAVVAAAFAARQAAGLARLAIPFDPLARDRALVSRASADLPLVASHALVFLPLAHYLPPADAQRVAFVARPPEVVRRIGVDTGARALRRLARVAPLWVAEYDTFVQAHPRFLVYGPPTWLVTKLLEDGAIVRLVDWHDDRLLLEVVRPAARQEQTAASRVQP